MSKYEQEILNTVNTRGTVTVAEIAQLLDVSDQTIRRIVKPMEKRGELKKVHGALVSNQDTMDPPFLSRMQTNRSAKVAIANCVASLIEDGSSLAIDTGSTSGFVAQILRQKRNLSVVTNSAFIASTLSLIEGNRVFMAGTQLRNHDGAAFDRAAYDVIASLSVEYAILSASGVHPEMGFLGYEQCEVDMARSMIAISDRSIFAVDSSKFQIADKFPPIRLPKLRPNDIVVSEARPHQDFDALVGPHLVVADGVVAGKKAKLVR
ncbi:MAG: DeoR/GlpR family DNA-binding transcription regulator [Roseovarius sp.]|uniref:DeoR/GlpR family DNA-binding transcription regulator n=1 Tax=Roseovarius sp. TaxID=1486281 RepID=UPI0032EFA178